MSRPASSTTHEPTSIGYALVWVALVVLATLSLLASRVLDRRLGLAAALTIAVLKAGLVAAFFMHLARGRPVHRMAFATAIAFVLLLVFGVVADVAARSTASAYVDESHEPAR